MWSREALGLLRGEACAVVKRGSRGCEACQKLCNSMGVAEVSEQPKDPVGCDGGEKLQQIKAQDHRLACVLLCGLAAVAAFGKAVGRVVDRYLVEHSVQDLTL